MRRSSRCSSPRADAGEQEALAALRGLDPLATTPLDALALLARLHERLRAGDVK